ncbi:GTP-binding protein Obg/CgtA [Chloroherpeton thalassium ATCC 35110]|uniref:GTPase Obg n=1 Tax=Chloroherpeton thalassium (strain ATCC 35110 / GB-78) TaxID=517418 RepID=OBG_CHLT3|nr:GTPase ObgE [Chloroherpeton thalassium]B3QVU6.1 RecName: Full=GTPase Obg; AltName: Full=GTP-binding protein Obg [Chloroherpeton thalassium ATCC 35110]ACF13153.1 GTP-binding protein Obg/CgtA [Chloroherpeton thalassium ATCC 35110]
MFIDSAKIYVKAGDGGKGCVSFRHEKFVPKGGPDGGDGGTGGSIFVKADANLATLLDFRYQRHYKAERGEHGQGSRKTGRSAKDVIIKVPVGTIVKDSETGEPLADLVYAGQEVLIAKGGHGGKGNQHFATPTNRAPRYSEPAGVGEERNIDLELKLLADIGLVGFPNAGKSTLISTISAARPKIANYPFTTLEPNLGIVRYAEYQSFVVADIPGIIEGASEGKGLGLKFLKHIERTKVLAILIPADTEDVQAEYDTLIEELRKFDESLCLKPRIVVLSKMDLVLEDASFEVPAFEGEKVVQISSVTGTGLQELKDVLWRIIQESNQQEESIT